MIHALCLNFCGIHGALFSMKIITNAVTAANDNSASSFRYEDIEPADARLDFTNLGENTWLI